jgi:hypothetical protein
MTCAPGSPTSFTINDEDRIYDRAGSAHPAHPTFGEYKRAVMRRSTEILYLLEPAQTILHTFSTRTHWMCARTRSTRTLAKERLFDSTRSLYLDISNGSVGIRTRRDERMFAMIFPSRGRELGIHLFRPLKSKEI